MFLVSMSKNLHMSFAAMTYLAEGLCLSALLTLKVQNSLICLAGTRIRSVHDEMAIYFVLKTVIRNKSSRRRRLE
jgi:hypothetical protein